MENLLRVRVASCACPPAQPAAAARAYCGLIGELREAPADVLLLPKLALSGASCGQLFRSSALLAACERALAQLREASAPFETYIFVGLPLRVGSSVGSVIAVLYAGELLGFLPSFDDPAGLDANIFPARMLPADTVFSCRGARFALLSCDPSLLAARIGKLPEAGIDLLLCPAFSPATVGSTQQALAGAQALSRSFGFALALSCGGGGETTHPYLYRPYCAIYEGGEALGIATGLDSPSVTADVDIDIVRSLAALPCPAPHAPAFSFAPPEPGETLLRPLRRNLFLPEEGYVRLSLLDELFELQALSLAGRLRATGLRRLVLGVSGGLDSTLAILVSAEALRRLKLPPENLIAVTLPGMGTSSQTYYNALALIEALGADGRDIPIRAAVLQHFEDIGHDPAEHNVVYENSQARERTQILFDIANGEGALVVGTGDLSEEALGFCTFGGDQLASYNVNVCLAKTVIRQLVSHLADRSPETLGAVLRDIVATPVSPELLPTDAEGQIAQKTEEILGPYELHDFFLYCFAGYHFAPSKIWRYACAAFAGSYEPAYIREKLRLFLRRFVGAQFKRSCAPDAAKLFPVTLLGVDFYIPSDLSAAVLLEELDSAK